MTPTTRPAPSLLGAHAALFAVAVFYGINYFVLRRTLLEISPFALLILRVVSGAAAFALLAWIARAGSIARRDWPRVALCGLFGIALNQMFFLWGMSKTLEVNGAVIMTITPVFVFLVAWLLRQETLTIRHILGLCVAFGGALWLSLSGRQAEFGSETLVGDALVLINAACYGIYLVLVRDLAQKYDTRLLVAGLFGAGMLFTLPIGLPFLIDTEWGSLSLTAWGGIAYVVVFVTLLAYSFNAWALKRAPSSQVGVYIYLQPVLVTSIAAFVRPDSLNTEKLLSMVLVLAGVLLVNWKR